jgi:tRNA(Ile)-lysidine synthase
VLKRFTGFIGKHSLCTTENTVLLAVSGGLDSMVMADLFLRAGFRIKVAHVNFQLRGAESDRDRDFISQYCAGKGVDFHTTTVETNNYATTHKLSIQMAARQLRYEWFHRLLDDGKGELIATAHHLNDSIETIILNLTRGSGNEGLMGIPVANNRIIRPLMFATRHELQQYASEHGVTWREDESNQSRDYQRNLVRHELIPVMRSINPGLEHSLQRTMIRAAGDEELILQALTEWKTRHVKVDGQQIRIDKQALASLKHPEALLLRLVEPLGFNLSQCIDLLDALKHQSGKAFQSSSHQIVIDRTHVFISRSLEVPAEVSISSGESSSVLGPFELAIHEQHQLDPVQDPMVAFLDKDKVSFPLCWRVWKDGDYFFPLGMTGRKKISDFLVDLKVPVPEKKNVTVIESQQGIICLPGFRIDDRFKITPKTRTALVINLKKATTKMPPVTEAS